MIPLVLYPSSMDSTKHITTLNENRWVTFRKVSQPDQSFQGKNFFFIEFVILKIPNFVV